MPAVPDTLNGICPYFTMFPLAFPQEVLQSANKDELVLDPFCGRGTTSFAARLAGLESFGIDSSPVAAAITASKLVRASVDEIVSEAIAILSGQSPSDIPQGEFWDWAYHPRVLVDVCKLREAFLVNCSTRARIALRGIVLGALHGPQQKKIQSYLSNQCPRTYAPKPRYATKFWKERELMPLDVDLLNVIERRARRYYSADTPEKGRVILADSRLEGTFASIRGEKFSWVVTSPPYYGMKTYIPDQWLRNWFVGGPSSVQYESPKQLIHTGPDAFSGDLKRVWINVASVCAKSARMVIRFGGISDRRADPLEVIKMSLDGSGWQISSIKNAGIATEGKRQADSFLLRKSKPVVEVDVWAEKVG